MCIEGQVTFHNCGSRRVSDLVPCHEYFIPGTPQNDYEGPGLQNMQLSTRKTQITSGSTQISVNHYRWMESPIQRQLPDDDRALDHKGMGTQDMHFGRASPRPKAHSWKSGVAGQCRTHNCVANETYLIFLDKWCIANHGVHGRTTFENQRQCSQYCGCHGDGTRRGYSVQCSLTQSCC